jgi:hypothetical protein
MREILIILLIAFTKMNFYSQEYQFVKADNGLIVRENTDKNSKRLGKLVYGSEVLITKNTGKKLELEDEGKIVKGEWVRIEEMDGELKGFVFSGFLTTKRLSKKIEVKFKDFIFEIPVNVIEAEKLGNKTHFEKAIIEVDIGDSPEGNKIKIYQSKYSKVEIFQQYETSITIMNEGPHCDLVDWKHFYSEWEKIPFNSKGNYFYSLNYSTSENERFINVSVEELKKEVKQSCGENWFELLKNIKKVNEYPSGVSISRILFKIILTDKNGTKNERIISFEIPMGC